MHDQPSRFLGRVAMMVVEGFAFRHGDPGIERACKKLVRIGDPCKCQHAAAFQYGHAVEVGNESAMEYRQRAATTLCNDVLCTDAFTDHWQGISLFELRGYWRSQGSGRKHRPIADAATRVHHRECKILLQRGVL